MTAVEPSARAAGDRPADVVARPRQTPWRRTLCRRCRLVFPARGGVPPRYCPACGRPVLSDQAKPPPPDPSRPLHSGAVVAVISGTLSLAVYPLALLAIPMGLWSIVELLWARGERGGIELAVTGVAFGGLGSSVAWRLAQMGS